MEANKNDAETKVGKNEEIDNDVDMVDDDSDSDAENDTSSDDEDDAREAELKKECETLQKHVRFRGSRNQITFHVCFLVLQVLLLLLTDICDVCFFVYP